MTMKEVAFMLECGNKRVRDLVDCGALGFRGERRAGPGGAPYEFEEVDVRRVVAEIRDRARVDGVKMSVALRRWLKDRNAQLAAAHEPAMQQPALPLGDPVAARLERLEAMVLALCREFGVRWREPEASDDRHQAM